MSFQAASPKLDRKHGELDADFTALGAPTMGQNVQGSGSMWLWLRSGEAAVSIETYPRSSMP
jgi:hypothetical protein